jgi:phosphoribosyl 1,2-cyclic phosphodiesterase
VKVTFYGTRGSLATPGRSTQRYGGNTSCVLVRGEEGSAIVLDAGTGIRAAGGDLPRDLRRVDVLLTHLHMDHIQGLGFFGPLYNPGVEVHIWGPASAMLALDARLSRYLSPPLFPVLLRDLPCRLHLHHVPCNEAEIGPFRMVAQGVCHPGPTVGYRLAEGGAVLTYIPDHEPALGAWNFPEEPEWTSGWDLARKADLLVHDAQYTREEYSSHVGWGHSSLQDALAFGALAGVGHLVLFHHDPARDDDALGAASRAAVTEARPSFPVTLAAEGDSFVLPASSART